MLHKYLELHDLKTFAKRLYVDNVLWRFATLLTKLAGTYLIAQYASPPGQVWARVTSPEATWAYVIPRLDTVKGWNARAN